MNILFTSYSFLLIFPHSIITSVTEVEFIAMDKQTNFSPTGKTFSLTK